MARKRKSPAGKPGSKEKSSSKEQYNSAAEDTKTFLAQVFARSIG